MSHELLQQSATAPYCAPHPAPVRRIRLDLVFLDVVAKCSSRRLNRQRLCWNGLQLSQRALQPGISSAPPAEPGLTTAAVHPSSSSISQLPVPAVPASVRSAESLCRAGLSSTISSNSGTVGLLVPVQSPRRRPRTFSTIRSNPSTATRTPGTTTSYTTATEETAHPRWESRSSSERVQFGSPPPVPRRRPPACSSSSCRPAPRSNSAAAWPGTGPLLQGRLHFYRIAQSRPRARGGPPPHLCSGQGTETLEREPEADRWVSGRVSFLCYVFSRRGSRIRRGQELNTGCPCPQVGHRRYRYLARYARSAREMDRGAQKAMAVEKSRRRKGARVAVFCSRTSLSSGSRLCSY